jgi:hypothetical protein
MRWFVTRAQEAEIREEATSAASAAAGLHYQQMREDRAAEVARLTDPQGPFVAHLRGEVEFWRAQFLHERNRADLAIDQCRVTHQAIGPITLPPREATERPGPDIFADPELAAMGLTEGVG